MKRLFAIVITGAMLMAVIPLAATAPRHATPLLGLSPKGRTTTCRGVLDATPGSEDTYSLGHCRIYADDSVGQAIRRACNGLGNRCKVRARVHDDMVTYVYSVTRSA